jgi:2-polyprenyl-6-methoxyphenol hydroxylase-like FAD-dependent oxidoreductase
MNIPLLPPVEADVLRHGNIQDNGRTNVKAVVAKGIAKSVPGTAYSYFSPDGSLACFAAPAGDGQSYWAVTLSDQMDASGSVTRYFVEAITATTAMKDLILSKLRSLNAPECQFAVELIEATDQEDMYVQRSEQFLRIGPTFVSNDNKVVLVGDAAHAMMSSYGQSANFAFEDATTLAVCLRDVSDTKKALGLYSISRLDRCIEMKRRSVERAERGLKGGKVEDDSEWITSWTVESVEDVYKALDESSKQSVEMKKAHHAHT